MSPWETVASYWHDSTKFELVVFTLVMGVVGAWIGTATFPPAQRLFLWALRPLGGLGRWLSHRLRTSIQAESLLHDELLKDPARAAAYVGQQAAGMVYWSVFLAMGTTTLFSLRHESLWIWVGVALLSWKWVSFGSRLSSFGNTAVREVSERAKSLAELVAHDGHRTYNAAEALHRAKLPPGTPSKDVEAHMAGMRRCGTCPHRLHEHDKNLPRACAVQGCGCTEFVLKKQKAWYRPT
jgi:hypothetical protein